MMRRVTIKEAARILGVEPLTIRRRIQRGEIQAEQQPQGGRYIWSVFLDDQAGKRVISAGRLADVLRDRSSDVSADISDVSTGDGPGVEIRLLKEQVRSRDELVETLKERVKAQDWQLGEILSQLREVQVRMLPPPADNRPWWRRLAGSGRA